LPEPGEILSEMDGAIVSSPDFRRLRHQFLEPGEILPESMNEEEIVYRGGPVVYRQQQQDHRIIFMQCGSRGPVPTPLHNISIASPVSSPRRLWAATTSAPPLGAPRLPPPQRQFSVIQGPVKRLPGVAGSKNKPETIKWSSDPSSSTSGQDEVTLPAPAAGMEEDNSLPAQPTNITHSIGAEASSGQEETPETSELCQEVNKASEDQSSEEKGRRQRQHSSGQAAKRRQKNDCSLVPVKKRRSLQEYPIFLGIAKNKVSHLCPWGT
jgi:hypothetical protein